MSDQNCQNCGAALNPRIALSKVVDCAHCGSTSILVDEAFRLAGERGVFHAEEGLIKLGQDVLVGATRVTPVGHCQFSYGRGLWDEFWCLDANDDGVWLSADEGDYALEYALEHPNGKFNLGQQIRIDGAAFRAVEVDSAQCTAFRGELPEILTLGEKHDYVVFAGYGPSMATLERWPGGYAWTRGRWYSAWDVKSP